MCELRSSRPTPFAIYASLETADETADEPVDALAPPAAESAPRAHRSVLRTVAFCTAMTVVAGFAGSMTVVSAAELGESNARATESFAATRSDAATIDKLALAASSRDAGAVAAATAVLNSSDGRVLDETARDALAAIIGDLEATTAAESSHKALTADLAAVATGRFPYLELPKAERITAELAATASANAVVLDTRVAALEEHSAVLSAAVAEWEAEQSRIAEAKAEAERVAAQEAARVAAEAAERAAAEASATAAARPGAGATNKSPGTAAQNSAPDGASAPSGRLAVSPTTTHFTVAVRTSVTSNGAADAALVQAAIDAGGQVAVEYPTVSGITIISAHNFNDATALALRTGDTVTFTGARDGTYRVVNEMDVVAGQKVSGVLGLGASMLMQTCYFGSGKMRMVGLAPA